MELSVCMSIKKSVLCIFHMSQKTIKVFCEQNRVSIYIRMKILQVGPMQGFAYHCNFMIFYES